MERIWTVEARDTESRDPLAHDWSEWTAWVDRATAEVEKQHAEDDGYEARIVRAR